MLTYSGGPNKEARLRLTSPASLIPIALVVMVTAGAFGSSTWRDSLVSELRFVHANGFFQHGLLTHWLVDNSSALAVTNALYALLAGCRVQADLGRSLAFAMFLLGAVAGVAAQHLFGLDAAGAVVGASGAIALWMGMAAAPYSLGSPEAAWGSLGLPALQLRFPFIAVVVVWFLHQAGGMVLAGRQGAGQYVALLVEFGLGVGLGLAARALRSRPQSEQDQPDDQPPQSQTARQLARALELAATKPQAAIPLLRQVLHREPRNVQASLALLDALSRGDGGSGAMVDEVVLRIAALLRGGDSRGAAALHERLCALQPDAPLPARLSAPLASALIEALARAKARSSAELLAKRWCAAHARDPDAWRVKETLAALKG